MPRKSLGLLAGLLAGAVADGVSDDGPCCHTCEAPKVRYYSVDSFNGHCGECCMDPKNFGIFKIFEPNLTLSGNVSCADLGFPVYSKTETHGLGPLSMTLDLYNPQGEQVAAPRDTVTLYKVLDGKCGQAVLDKKYESAAVQFAGLTEGDCASQGYTVPAGSKQLSVPVLGSVTVDLFTKPATIVV